MAGCSIKWTRERLHGRAVVAGFGGRCGHSKAQAALRARCSSTGTLQKGLQCIACSTIRATPDHIIKGLLIVELFDAIQLQMSKQRLGACARWQAEYGACRTVLLDLKAGPLVLSKAPRERHGPVEQIWHHNGFHVLLSGLSCKATAGSPECSHLLRGLLHSIVNVFVNRTCSSIVTPRYFAWGTAGSGFPRHLTVMSWPEIRRTWLLLVFRIRFRSWRWLAISVVDVVRTRDTSWQSGWLKVRAISSANCTERDGLAMVGTCLV